PGAAEVTVGWEEIKYLEERPDQKVDIVTDNPARVVPVFYATRNFGELLGRLCSKLAVLHRDKMEALTFRGSRSYFTHLGIVLGLLTVFLMGGVLYLNFFEPGMLLIAALTLPIGVHLVLQPIEVTLGDGGLLVRDFFRRRLFDYNALEALRFDVRGDQYVRFLRIIITLRGGRQIKITRFGNLILLFILIESRLNHHSRKQRSTDRMEKTP
ncbi:MAG: hypothetical protein JJV98_12735, partial [Desulfosarcina sp.]|nr:hypothetical protein [Desulfobacterales bacterium]